MVDRIAKENFLHVAESNSDSVRSNSYIGCVSGTFTVYLLTFIPHPIVQSDTRLLVGALRRDKMMERNTAEMLEK